MAHDGSNRWKRVGLILHSVETLDIAVPHGLARRDFVPFDFVVFGPNQDRIRRELGAVVGGGHAGFAAPFDQCRQFASNPTAGDRGVRDRCREFALDIINDIEHSKAFAAGQLIMDEIQRALTLSSTRIGARMPTACLRAFRLRTGSHSSR